MAANIVNKTIHSGICAQPYFAALLLMPAVLLAATSTAALLHVCTKWASYGRGSAPSYRKYSFDFQVCHAACVESAIL